MADWIIFFKAFPGTIMAIYGMEVNDSVFSWAPDNILSAIVDVIPG